MTERPSNLHKIPITLKMPQHFPNFWSSPRHHSDTCQIKRKKLKVCQLFLRINVRATERHLPYEITQCYLPPNTGEHPHLNPSQAGWYSTDLPWRDGRL